MILKIGKSCGPSTNSLFLSSNFKKLFTNWKSHKQSNIVKNGQKLQQQKKKERNKRKEKKIEPIREEYLPVNY
jgi:hypothetical protein